MTLKKRILTGIGALAFSALLALNMKLVNSSNIQEAGFASLSLVELEVQAQSEGGEGGGGCSATATCFINSTEPPYGPVPYGSVSCSGTSSGTSSCTAYYERVVCDGNEQACGQ